MRQRKLQSRSSPDDISYKDECEQEEIIAKLKKTGEKNAETIGKMFSLLCLIVSFAFIACLFLPNLKHKTWLINNGFSTNSMSATYLAFIFCSLCSHMIIMGRKGYFSKGLVVSTLLLLFWGKFLGELDHVPPHLLWLPFGALSFLLFSFYLMKNLDELRTAPNMLEAFKYSFKKA
mmetsp:Transcript_19469/g.28839  ORF Transcript_19469/g.28839 Transcript_19469/m.28839 type:complete len:176 (-) Transcript_19469:28-555(-)